MGPDSYNSYVTGTIMFNSKKILCNIKNVKYLITGIYDDVNPIDIIQDPVCFI